MKNWNEVQEALIEEARDHFPDASQVFLRNEALEQACKCIVELNMFAIQRRDSMASDSTRIAKLEADRQFCLAQLRLLSKRLTR